jgi:hypothetical protein
MAYVFDRTRYKTDQEAIAAGLFAVANAIQDLGNGDAATPMGAIEAFGMVMKEGLSDISDSIASLNASIENLHE